MPTEVASAPRTVLITGCSSGIGRAAARALRDVGFRVIATARKEEDLESLTAEGFDTLRLDLADRDSVELCAGRALSLAGGRLWGLVNNAAFAVPGAVEDLSRDALRDQFETNVFGTHQLTTLVLPALREAGEGRIVTIGSVLGFVSMPWRGAYNASKHALHALTDTLRLELAGSGIQVSLVEPGPVATRFRINAQQAFDARVDVERSRHADTYERMRKARSDPEGKLPMSVGPEAIAQRIVHALTAERAKTRYLVTKPTWALEIARRLLPRRVLDWVLRRT